jgi:uncharacterized cupredoxin-like copper-binding protein
MAVRKEITSSDEPIEGETVIAREIRELVLQDGKPVVKFQAPTDGQIAVISKDINAARRDPTKSVELMWTFFRIIELLLLNPDDGHRIEDALLEGTLELNDLTTAIYGANNVVSRPARTRRR